MPNICTLGTCDIGGTLSIAQGGTGTVTAVHPSVGAADAIAGAITVGDSTAGGTLPADTPCDRPDYVVGLEGYNDVGPPPAPVSFAPAAAVPARPPVAPPWRPDYDLIGTLLTACFALYVVRRWRQIVEPHPRPPAPPPLPYRGVELD